MKCPACSNEMTQVEVQDISTSGASQLQVDLNFGLFGFPPATADW